jgi:hypothetical protein
LPLFICIAFIPKVNDGEKSDTTNYKQNRIWKANFHDVKILLGKLNSKFQN